MASIKNQALPVASASVPVTVIKKAETTPAAQTMPERSTPVHVAPSQAQEWQKFIELIKTRVEPLVLTLFSSATARYIPATQRCEVNCLKEHELFKEWLDNSVAIWKPLLHEAFGTSVELDITFKQLKDASKPIVARQPVSQPRPVSSSVQQPYSAKATKSEAKPVSENVSKALKLFPGTIQEV